MQTQFDRGALTVTLPVAVITLCVFALSASAADFGSQRAYNWHQWRGPNANGTAENVNPAIEWGEGKNLKWKVAVPGKGSATPVVWDDRIFVLTAVPGGGDGRPANLQQFVILCMDRRTGATVWQRVAAELVPHEGHHETNTYASGSAITDGRFVYTSFGSRGIYCYDFNGDLQWKQDLGDMRTRNGFGEGATPTLHGDTLVVPWDNDGHSFVAALDAKSGEVLWRTDRNEKSTWATPLVVEHAGRTQLIMNGSNRVRSYDLADGSLVWECGGQASNPIPSPLTLDGVVFCMTGYRGFAVYAIPLSASGDITDSNKIAWHRKDSGPYVSSPVLYKGLIYHTKDRHPILSCLDAKTGEPLINQQRIPGMDAWIYSSPVAAADRVYFTDREGTTVVIKHGAPLEVLATNKLDEGVDASPALIGDEMYLRGETHLYCIRDSQL